jgi:ABC-type glycerol-3-phosphate transport system permease component
MTDAPTHALFALVKVVLGLAYLVPLAWIVITSFKSTTQVLQDPNKIVFVPTLDTYREVVGEGATAIVTSLQISVIVTVVVAALAVPAAFAAAARLSTGAARVIAAALAGLLVLQMIPQPMTVIPLFSVLAQWGILNTLPGLIIADVAVIAAVRDHAAAAVRAVRPARAVRGGGDRRRRAVAVVPLDHRADDA